MPSVWCGSKLASRVVLGLLQRTNRGPERYVKEPLRLPGRGRCQRRVRSECEAAHSHVKVSPSSQHLDRATTSNYMDSDRKILVARCSTIKCRWDVKRRSARP